ncbi:MAG: lipocalin family protein [Bacteroidales bacterium]
MPKLLTTLTLSLMLILSPNAGAKDYVQLLDSFDLERYLGKWYEIARYDHSFERGLVGVTATYLMNDDGTIRVENRGYKGTLMGKQKLAVGKAKLAESKLPGMLKVSFFLWFYSDYNILYLDPEYEYALIGSSTPKYFWILSRTPTINKETKDDLLRKAKALGYSTDELIWVPQ